MQRASAWEWRMWSWKLLNRNGSWAGQETVRRPGPPGEKKRRFLRKPGAFCCRRGSWKPKALGVLRSFAAFRRFTSETGRESEPAVPRDSPPFSQSRSAILVARRAYVARKRKSCEVSQHSKSAARVNWPNLQTWHALRLRERAGEPLPGLRAARRRSLRLARESPTRLLSCQPACVTPQWRHEPRPFRAAFSHPGVLLFHVLRRDGGGSHPSSREGRGRRRCLLHGRGDRDQGRQGPSRGH
jgi:hypothetical protein